MKIIFVSLDTLRASRLGCYGYRLPTSPYMDRIAAEGVLFEKAYASDIPTEVAHTSVFTGRMGLSTGVVSHGSTLSSLPKTTDWLPSIMRAAGFATAAVDNLYQLKEWFARGFRYYINSSNVRQRWIEGRAVNALAFPWLAEHKDEPFFLFLHYWDAHTPYLPPEEHKHAFYPADRDPFDPANRSMEPAYNHLAYPFFKYHHYDLAGNVTDSAYYDAMYDAEIRGLDDRLRELDEHLERLGIREETLLVLFGDHGESLTEHDIYWDHCGLYEPTVHVPVIMRWPGVIPAGRRVSGFVRHVDLMPTVLEAVRMGAKFPGFDAASAGVPEGIDGKSLWPAIRGECEGTTDVVYLSECAWQAARGVRTGRYKYIRTYDSGLFKRPPCELYDLADDPGETRNLAAILPDVAAELQAKLDRWVEETLAGREDPMQVQLATEGLPFRRRIEAILAKAGMTWDDWFGDPRKERFDRAIEAMRAKGGKK